MRTYAAIAAPFERDLEACLARVASSLSEARAVGAELAVYPECELGGPPGCHEEDSPLPPGISLEGPEIARICLAPRGGRSPICAIAGPWPTGDCPPTGSP